MLHGGDIYRNKVNIDFSVNINPLGMPEAVKDALLHAVGHCEEYPDIKAEALKESISVRTGVNQGWIVTGNGASELFCAIVHALCPRRIVIPVPSFFGYEWASRASDSELIFYPMKAEWGYELEEGLMQCLTEEVDLLFLANPNNPVGNLIESNLLEKIAEHCSKNKITLVIDECFLEFTGEEDRYSYKNKLDRYPNVIVVRAFTKIYAIPGVRLGYLICGSSHWRQRIEEQLPEWNLSVFAQGAGLAACAEKEYVDRTVRYVSRERQYLAGELERLGLKVYPSDANYLLLETGINLYDRLLEKGLLIRDCSNYRGLRQGFYRVAVKTHPENEMLLKAIREIRYTYDGIKQGRPVTMDINNFEKVLLEEALYGTAGKTGLEALEVLLPEEIEKRSFEIIARELEERNLRLRPDQEMVIKRAIHTSADFDYACTLTFSEGAVERAKELIREGADIVTDTNMALAGINKNVLARYGGRAHCFMAEKEVAELARERQTTRAAVSMEKASQLDKPVIFAVGNAPTALIQLYEMLEQKRYRPAFIIGVPVGFVNVVLAKELIMNTDVPHIVNRGRKGGSNVAAAICNAILYELGR